ncbi:hypothetical protein Y1Q_0011342 [Alligator mississippiensis]|uniref:Uncharacterized protein n=1 Tax=Alligator mississippiensis TaxID=8496 RepID=A0A151N961_ALLMI|nr:hypothetical protein Y1Q_0011342 [Alligator mississippiensis]
MALSSTCRPEPQISTNQEIRTSDPKNKGHLQQAQSSTLVPVGLSEDIRAASLLKPLAAGRPTLTLKSQSQSTVPLFG